MESQVDRVSLTRQEIEQIKQGFVLITEVHKTFENRLVKIEAAQSLNQTQDSEMARQLAKLSAVLEQLQIRSIEQKDSLLMIPDISYKLTTLTKDFDIHEKEGKEQSKEQSTKFNSLQNGLIVAGFSFFLAFIGSQIIPYLQYHRQASEPHQNSKPSNPSSNQSNVK